MSEELHVVRAFLNTWELPNGTRVPEDHLAALAADPGAWSAALPGVPRPGDVGAARALRDDLRAAAGTGRPAMLGPRLDAVRLRPVVEADGDPVLRLVPDPATTESVLLTHVAEGVRDGSWWRLRTCPDCGWAFYDSSRNGRRTWCSMTAGPGARGCGSIAKTRTYRARLTAAKSRT